MYYFRNIFVDNFRTVNQFADQGSLQMNLSSAEMWTVFSIIYLYKFWCEFWFLPLTVTFGCDYSGIVACTDELTSVPIEQLSADICG